MVSRFIVLGISAMIFLALWSNRNDPNMVANDGLPKLRFEHYAAPLGFGAADELAAKRDFIEAFPIGTPLSRLSAFFQRIGGKCFTLPIDWPGQLLCHYDHPKYTLLPFLPLRSTWLVTVWFDEESQTAIRIDLTSGIEGL